jgi:hypothetical protein
VAGEVAAQQQSFADQNRRQSLGLEPSEQELLMPDIKSGLKRNGRETRFERGNGVKTGCRLQMRSKESQGTADCALRCKFLTWSQAGEDIDPRNSVFDFVFVRRLSNSSIASTVERGLNTLRKTQTRLSSSGGSRSSSLRVPER